MKTYPYRKLPTKVEKYLSGEIVDLVELELPQKPNLKKYDYVGYLIAIAFFCIILLLIYFEVNYWQAYLILGFISLGAISMSRSDNKMVKLTNKELNLRYQESTNSVITENTKRNKLKNSLRHSNLEQSYIKEKIKEELRSYSSPDLINCHTKKGLSESYFIRFLFEYFRNCIKPFTRLHETFNYTYEYQPDFVFQNKDICIDIEIDEPYVMEGRKPIHLLDENSDSYRDDFFISNNWCVIRFSEEQTLLYPYGCCKYIAQLIFELTADDQFLKKLNYRGTLKTINKWTKLQAEQMAKENHRELIYLQANNQASQPEYFPVNFFTDKKVLLTKVGEWNENYHLCLNNNFYGPQKTIACNKSLVTEWKHGETLEFEIDNYKLENDYSTHSGPTEYYDGQCSNYQEYKVPIVRIDKQK